jgi:hypothetical protein
MAKIISLPNIGTILNLISGRRNAMHRVAMPSRTPYFIAWAGGNPYHDIKAATIRR